MPVSCHVCRHPVSAMDRLSVDTSAHPVGGRPRLGKGWALFGIRPASSSGAMGTLLPSKLYSKVGAISGSTLPGAGCESEPCPPPPVGFASYSDLRVVAMRIDPCFASLAPDPHGANCSAEIRLIFQQVLVGETGSRPSAFDSGLHVFYSLTREEILALAQALVALRMTNETDVSLGSLAPHPILVKQGLGGPFSKGVEQLILKVAGEKNLTRVAALSSTVAFPAWGLHAVNVTNAAEGAMSPFVIPTLAVTIPSVLPVCGIANVSTAARMRSAATRANSSAGPPVRTVARRASG